MDHPLNLYNPNLYALAKEKQQKHQNTVTITKTTTTTTTTISSNNLKIRPMLTKPGEKFRSVPRGAALLPPPYPLPIPPNQPQPQPQQPQQRSDNLSLGQLDLSQQAKSNPTVVQSATQDNQQLVPKTTTQTNSSSPRNSTPMFSNVSVCLSNQEVSSYVEESPKYGKLRIWLLKIYLNVDFFSIFKEYDYSQPAIIEETTPARETRVANSKAKKKKERKKVKMLDSDDEDCKFVFLGVVVKVQPQTHKFSKVFFFFQK